MTKTPKESVGMKYDSFQKIEQLSIWFACRKIGIPVHLVDRYSLAFPKKYLKIVDELNDAMFQEV